MMDYLILTASFLLLYFVSVAKVVLDLKGYIANPSSDIKIPKALKIEQVSEHHYFSIYLSFVVFILSFCSVSAIIIFNLFDVDLEKSFYHTFFITVLAAVFIAIYSIMRWFNAVLIQKTSVFSFFQWGKGFYEFFYYSLFPVHWLVSFLSKKFVKTQSDKENSTWLLSPLTYISQNLIDNIKQNKSSADKELIYNAIKFQDAKVKDCMTPRTEIAAIEIRQSIEELKDLFIQTNFSKIIVYKDHIDDIVGYVHHLRIYDNPSQISDIVNDIMIASERMLAKELMLAFAEKRKSIALVVDEYGGTEGLVTLEDLIEEIFGDIQDEYDDENLLEKKIGEEEYFLSGRQEIEYLNETYGLDLPIGEYETIAGLILTISKEIPKENEVVSFEDWHCKIKSLKGAVIDKVYLYKNKMPEKLD